jgi:poly(3-hydroxybutyrate) depolymerase
MMGWYTLAVVAATISFLRPVKCDPITSSGGTCQVSSKYKKGEFQLVDISVGKLQRKVLVYLPRSMREGETVPLLFGYHGWHSNPWYFSNLMNITHYAEKYTFALAMGIGTSMGTWSSPICCPAFCDETCCAKGDKLDVVRPCGWNEGQSEAKLPRFRGVDDIAYAKASAELLSAQACVDVSSVFAIGFSMGGSMTNRAACEGADFFRGVVAISGGLDMPLEACQPAKPLPVSLFCGTADPGCFQGVNQTFEMWASRNGCTDSAKTSYRTETTTCEMYSQCRDGATVERCLILNLGDEMPGHNRSKPLYPGEPMQPITNVDAVDYSFKTFERILGVKPLIALAPVVV